MTILILLRPTVDFSFSVFIKTFILCSNCIDDERFNYFPSSVLNVNIQHTASKISCLPAQWWQRYTILKQHNTELCPLTRNLNN